jgi:ElaB/YqjD/DUF883 family membrane-anchored ribosome-binding protein
MTSETMQSTDGTTSSGSQGPERLQQAASGIIDQAGRTAETQASRTMDRAGDALQEVARVVRDSGNQLREQRPEIAGLADTAAERVEQVSSYLREHDAREIMTEAERFARRQPALVVGGGLALGLLIGRVLRSGSEQGSMGQSSQFASGHGQSGWYGGTSGSGTPGNGYGTGYGTSYDRGTGGLADTAGNLAATDAAAGSTDYSGGVGSTSYGGSGSTGYGGSGGTGSSGIYAGTDTGDLAGSSALGSTGDYGSTDYGVGDTTGETQTIDAAGSGAMDVGEAGSAKSRKRRTKADE